MMSPLIPLIHMAALGLMVLTAPARAADELQTRDLPAAPAPMDNNRLGELIEGIGKNMSGGDGFWRFTVENHRVLVITDKNADRMRIMVAVAEAKALTSNELMRIMQANFDSALDARYAVARGMVWSVFLHPLGALTDTEFLSGLAQVVNLAATYGSSYSSGVLMFRGGDSEQLNRKRYEKIMRKGKAI